MTPNPSAHALFSSGRSGPEPADPADAARRRDDGSSHGAANECLARSVAALRHSTARLEDVQQMFAELEAIERDRRQATADPQELARRCIAIWQQVRAMAEQLGRPPHSGSLP